MPDAPRLEGYARQHEHRILETLAAWLRIPSISASPQHAADVERSAAFCADLLREAGLENVEVLPTAGAPAVYADWLHAGPNAPTVLVYGHHDVQPVDPLDAWVHPPFEPTVIGDELFARGAVDDKGQVAYQIEAARALLALDGALPVNLKFLIEGEEEVGSPHFEVLLQEHRERFAAEVVVVSDTGMIAPHVPSTDVAMRGLVAFTLRLRTAHSDLHSGLFGGAVPNPVHHLARLLASLHDDEGRVAIPGFYDDVRPLEASEAASLASQPFDADAFRRTAGVGALEGEAGRSTLERIGSRPTAEVVGIHGGYTGEGMKTIVPAVAEAKITFRLVPDQLPDTTAARFEAWLQRSVAEHVAVEVERHGGVAPASTPVDHWAMGALRLAIARVWGTDPLFTRVGGSGPEETLGRVLAAPVLYLGVGLPDDRIHAPNERIVLSQFWRGLQAAGELWPALAAARPAGEVTDV